MDLDRIAIALAVVLVFVLWGWSEAPSWLWWVLVAMWVVAELASGGLPGWLRCAPLACSPLRYHHYPNQSPPVLPQSQATRAVPASRSAHATARARAAQASTGARHTGAPVAVAQSADGDRAAKSALHSRVVDQVGHPDGRGVIAQHSSRRAHTASYASTQTSLALAVVQASTPASVGGAGAAQERATRATRATSDRVIERSYTEGGK
jgi:hypothetical protein